MKLLPTFRCTGYPRRSSHEIRDSCPPSSEGTRCNASANPICAFLMPAIRLIDTRLASHSRSLRKPGGGRADEGNRRQYRRGGFVLSQAVFTGSCSDSTRAGRFLGASQLGPIHRRHATRRSPCGPVGTIAVWTPPSGRRGYRESRGAGQLGVLQRTQRAGGHGPPHGPERRAHPRVRTPGPLEAGRRHGRPLPPAANPLARRCGTCNGGVTRVRRNHQRAQRWLPQRFPFE